MPLIPESIVVRLRDPDTGETTTQKIPLGEPWPFVVARSKQGGPKKEERSPSGEKAKEKSKPRRRRPKAPRRDLRDFEVKETFAKEVYDAVHGGLTRPSQIAKRLDVDPMQVIEILREFVEAGDFVQTGRGRKALYTVPGPETPAPEPLAAPEVLPTEPQAPTKLRWSKDVVSGRETLAAPFGDGAFRIVPLRSGKNALFYEGDDNTVFEYGCGETKALRIRAKELAAAGLPTPEAYQAAGGDLSRCPQPRRLRLDDVELTWRETVEGGRQVCVAATGDGEFKMLQSHGGSFILVFVREGDAEIDRLGCGSREELEGRALDVLGQAELPEGEAAEAAETIAPVEPVRPPDQGEGVEPVAPSTGDPAPAAEKALLGNFADAIFDHLDAEDD
jgi:hypothetical protein